jgi:hypothetical protein
MERGRRGRDMTNSDIMQEIEELKKQLLALEAAKGHGSAQAPPEESQQSSREETGGESGTWLRDLIKQAEELMGGLDLQFKDVPAKTALVIFALGILTGRLLSRRG